jgi:hypothetical protein
MTTRVDSHNEAADNGANGTVLIVLPGYRACYAAHDFTNTKARSLDNSIANYLSRSVMRMPWGSPKKLVFQLAGQKKDSEQEKVTVNSYREMFTWRARAAVRKLVRQLPLAVTLVAIGISILWVSNRVDDVNIEENVKNTLSDVVQVGAWVALWSAISLLFSTGFESLQYYIAFRRLANVPIKFHYETRSNRFSNNAGESVKSRGVRESATVSQVRGTAEP